MNKQTPKEKKKPNLLIHLSCKTHIIISLIASNKRFVYGRQKFYDFQLTIGIRIPDNNPMCIYL